ncbi:outer membrane protein OmpA-like peptidoglycan-associated protein [Variovorax sp. SG517]|uniref:OmpA family protein n=1 Tax=Variovorax sp. SG517 TaxID=2587117 RepID=UPI0017D68418|nr:OmpA family protein [Variovorax sp. SG517]NVM89657.1 outer membrane protein OmpA-like peptidoglycan-associated protein [Variovorax sp. SG517]
MTKMQFHRFSAIAVGIAALLVLQACGTSSVSKGISDDGKATEVVFPDIDNDAWLKEGTFPNLANLRAVAPGVTKDQLYDLLGRPHFREGMAGPREWDYIFHFHKAGGGVTTCQYKAIFDKDYKAQSFYWLPTGCGDVLAQPVAAVAPAPVPPPMLRKVTLGAGGLFRFDGAAAADLMPEGRRKVEVLARDIKGNFKSSSAISVTGHTDRLGSDSYNNALSLARANTVRDLLVRQGIDSSAIRTQGVGKNRPVVECPGMHKTEALIGCLQPNRRVEIEVSGEQ